MPNTSTKLIRFNVSRWLAGREKVGHHSTITNNALHCVTEYRAAAFPSRCILSGRRTSRIMIYWNLQALLLVVRTLSHPRECSNATVERNECREKTKQKQHSKLWKCEIVQREKTCIMWGSQSGQTMLGWCTSGTGECAPGTRLSFFASWPHNPLPASPFLFPYGTYQSAHNSSRSWSEFTTSEK